MNIVKFYRGNEVKLVKVGQYSADRMAAEIDKRLPHPTLPQANREMYRQGWQRTKPAERDK